MTVTDEPKKKRNWWKIAAIAGTLLGVACHALPPKYQAPCQTAARVISICTGGN